MSGGEGGREGGRKSCDYCQLMPQSVILEREERGESEKEREGEEFTCLTGR